VIESTPGEAGSVTVVAMTGEYSEPILHVDMDAFFVEVERLRRPDLRGVPVVVGGLGTRGVVAAASYEARRFGVHSAMPIVHARRLCPRARYVPPDHRAYSEMSARVFAVLGSVTPMVEGLSVDEAFLDVSGLRLHYPDARAVAVEVRRRLRRELGLPASVGVATSKLIAKLASEEAKPDGLVVVAAGTELAFLHPLPVRRLWGVGEATHAALEGLGVATIGDLAIIPADTLGRRLGPTIGAHLADLAAARDDRPVTPGGEAASVSVEATYEEDLVDLGDIERELLRHCDRLALRLRRGGHAGRVVVLKVRFDDFTTVTRSHTLTEPIDATPELWEAVRGLLARVPVAGRRVRLLGVGAQGLVAAGAPRQISLTGERRSAVADATDRVRARFGESSVRPARLVDPPGAGPKQQGPGGAP
jgi:DNA polymerase-4